jgi:hypothetical protein
MIIGKIEIAPALKHSFKLTEKISPLAIIIVSTADKNTFIQDPYIVFKNFITSFLLSW